MGCGSSKQPVCRNCRARCSPMSRSYSMHVHHPPQREGDTYHVVALTSTTLGSLKLDSLNANLYNSEEHTTQTTNGGDDDINVHSKRKEEFSMGVIEAKTWSKMIDEKIPKIVPKTPTRTPPGEPETINAWELMEGLEDTSPLRPPAYHHHRSFSFHVAPNPVPSPRSKPQENGESTWFEMVDKESNLNSNSDSNSNETSIMSEFDPDVISTFREALEKLPPTNPFHLEPSESEKQRVDDSDVITDDNKFTLPSSKDRVVVYFTSLRGVRKTYEDCCHVRVILKGIGVRVDERDVSMHSGFKEELKELLPGNGLIGVGLPRVFLGRKYIGGAEEIRRMHEEGQLEKLLVDCCEMVAGGGGGGGGGVCEACGDIRFVPCETCSGSCKIYCEGDYYDEEEECDESDCGFQRCPDCNENGIIRCPICCD